MRYRSVPKKQRRTIIYCNTAKEVLDQDFHASLHILENILSAYERTREHYVRVLLHDWNGDDEKSATRRPP